MIVSLEEMKNFMRIDYDDDDSLIAALILRSQQICADVARLDTEKLAEQSICKTAVMYTVAYLYEHRENADFNKLKLSLRALLSDIRKAGF